MKPSIISMSMTSIVIAVLLFLLTMSTAFAQEATQLRTKAVNINDTRSELLQADSDKTPTRRILENTEQEVRKVNVKNLEVRRIDGENVDREKRSTFEKARALFKREKQGEDRRLEQEKDKEEREARIKEQKKKRVAGFLENVTRKMQAAIARLFKIAGRIESRIVKFELREVDMSQARSLLGVARDSIESAEKNTESALESAREALNTDEVVRSAFGGVVSELTKTRENLRTAHKALVEVIRIMKANIGADNKSKDETVETN